MGHNVRAYVCGRLQDGKSQFSSAEVLLSVTGREKQAFHSGEIKLELKNQNIWIWILQISFRKCAGPLCFPFTYRKLGSTPDSYQLPSEPGLRATLLARCCCYVLQRPSSIWAPLQPPALPAWGKPDGRSEKTDLKYFLRDLLQKYQRCSHGIACGSQKLVPGS